MSWDDVDINKDNYRSISPRSRSYGIGVYNQDPMLNLASLRGLMNRVNSWSYWSSNNGNATNLSPEQVTTLADRPTIFWDGHRHDYSTYGSAGDFIAQNNSTGFYSIWRLSDDSNIIADISGGNEEALWLINHDNTWDEQLFTVNGQGGENTANGSPLSKMGVSVARTDFSASRPLIMSLTGGLPRGGGDVVSKSEPGDAWWRAGDYDYYLNYYPKYDETAKKLLAKDDGMDWGTLQNRAQIDGTQPTSTLLASALSAQVGYSRVGKIAYMKLN